MILTDSDGNQVDWFDTFFKKLKTKTIYTHITGGTDTALTFYILCKIIHDNKMDDYTIVSMNVNNLNAVDVQDKIKIIIDTILSIYPIRHRYVVHEAKLSGEKGPSLIQLGKLAGVTENDIIINSTQPVPAELEDLVYLKEKDGWPIDRIKDNMKITDHIINSRPWYNVDKKFIKDQYIKFDLMHNVFPHTISCTCSYQDLTPCKKCYWCREKYWAFGMYDGGVK